METSIASSDRGGDYVAPVMRPTLSNVAPYRPGRTEADARRDHGLVSAVKLASNEMACDLLPSVRSAVEDWLGQANRYPDNRADALRERLAHLVGLHQERVAVGCGSVALLQQLALAFSEPGVEVAYGWRTFEAYPGFVALAGADERRVPLRSQTIDLSALGGVLGERTRLALLANPNNPTSTSVTGSELEELLDRAPSDCLVIVDEAYHEFVTGAHVPDAAAYLDRYPNLGVLRTFSKAYGLANLRVGYLLGSPEVVTAVNKAAVPFAVSGFAQVAACAALEAQEEMRERVAEVVIRRDRLAQELRHAGLGTPESQGNFLWLASGSQTDELASGLERRGVVTRAFSGDGIRLSIGSEDEMDLFWSALSETSSEIDLEAGWQVATGDLAVKTHDIVRRLHEIRRDLGTSAGDALAPPELQKALDQLRANIADARPLRPGLTSAGVLDHALSLICEVRPDKVSADRLEDLVQRLIVTPLLRAEASTR